MNWILLALLIVTGLYDIYLVVKRHPTLSQQYQKLFPAWVDMVSFVQMLCLLLFCFSWMDWRIKIIIAAFGGHILFPSKETYKR